MADFGYGQNVFNRPIPGKELLLLFLLLLFVTTFTHGIYNYVPKTNHIYSVRRVAAILWVQFLLHVFIIIIISYHLCARYL